MPVKARSATQSPKEGEFNSRYTRNPDGFYVRNKPPSAGTLNEKRISDNIRELLKEISDSENSDAE